MNTIKHIAKAAALSAQRNGSTARVAGAGVVGLTLDALLESAQGRKLSHMTRFCGYWYAWAV